MSTGKPTYWSTDLKKIPDLLDFFVTRIILVNCMRVEEVWDMHSDHFPILLVLSVSIV